MSKTTGAIKSANHLGFARGSIGGAGENLVAITADVARPGDYEFFADASGDLVYRADVGHDPVLRKGAFMARVRWPAQLIMVGWPRALYVAQKFHAEVPASVVAAEKREAEEASAMRSSTGVPSTEPHSQRAPSRASELPDGWSLENKKTSAGRKYKVYVAPDGKKFQSFKKAKDYMGGA